MAFTALKNKLTSVLLSSALQLTSQQNTGGNQEAIREKLAGISEQITDNLEQEVASFADETVADALEDFSPDPEPQQLDSSPSPAFDNPARPAKPRKINPRRGKDWERLNNQLADEEQQTKSPPQPSPEPENTTPETANTVPEDAGKKDEPSTDDIPPETPPSDTPPQQEDADSPQQPATPNDTDSTDQRESVQPSESTTGAAEETDSGGASQQAQALQIQAQQINEEEKNIAQQIKQKKGKIEKELLPLKWILRGLKLTKFALGVWLATLSLFTFLCILTAVLIIILGGVLVPTITAAFAKYIGTKNKVKQMEKKIEEERASMEKREGIPELIKALSEKGTEMKQVSTQLNNLRSSPT